MKTTENIYGEKYKMITYYIKGSEDLDKHIEMEIMMRKNNIKIGDTGMFISDFPRKGDIQAPAVQVNDAIDILINTGFEIVSIKDDTDI